MTTGQGVLQDPLPLFFQILGIHGDTQGGGPENWLNFINPGVYESPQEVVENLPQSTINGCFFYKANHAQELMEDKTTQPTQVEVVKVIQLSA